jgi:predicted nuclease of predicted toxin-antitoxin system
MAGIRLLADLNISPLSVAILRRHGWDVIRVSEILPPTAPDREILGRARADGRAVLTEDLDFSALLAVGGFDTPNLVTLRLSQSDPEIVAARLLEAEALLERSLSESCAITLDDRTLRIRPLPIR